MTRPGETFHQRLLDAAPDALVAVDAAGRIRLVNAAAERLFDRPRSELLGAPLDTLGPGRCRDDYARLLADERVQTAELTGLRREGTECSLQVSCSRMATDLGGWLVLSLRDVSGQQMLRVEQMMALGQVAAGVAHELRNPLTSIKGLVQVNLRERSYQGLPADDLAVIDHEIRRMERTLQTFLDFARPAQPNRCRLDLASVVERVLALVSGRARKQQVVVRLLGADAPRPVEADQDQLQQLLLNLVLNALDALPHGGTVEVDLRPPRDRHVEVHVRDTGPGIAPHILPRVFETFVSSKETGVGLGLPVSRRIAEDHGGGLSAFNLPEGGACFVLRLPALDDAPWRSHADSAGGG